MRLAIDHRTVYRFSAPQSRLVQMLRMTPENTHDQTVASWRVDVDCDAKMRPARDGFGNRGTMLYVEGPVDGIEIVVSGKVLTSHSNGVLRGASEAFPPALFLRTTELTPAASEIAAFASDEAKGVKLLTALHRLNEALHDRFTIANERPEPGLDAAAAFTRDSVTPRDLAHIFVVAARSLGAPARYVSGYRLAGERHAPTPHGWSEAYVDEIGWVGFDSCTGRCPEEEYVRIANALDSVGAAPVAGSRLGEGEEELDVDVTVSRTQ